MIYSPGFVLGFHGCDKAVAERIVLRSETIKKSENKYDWLGHGVYFWENNPRRALEYANLVVRREKGKSKIKKPYVLGAIIDLGRCLNLLESESIEIVKKGHTLLCKTFALTGQKLPENRKPDDVGDPLLRDLDCAVIETIHQSYSENNLPPYDTVRAVFQEGNHIYTDAGFREKTHIQICVRNLSCIKGLFIPDNADQMINPIVLTDEPGLQK